MGKDLPNPLQRPDRRDCVNFPFLAEPLKLGETAIEGTKIQIFSNFNTFRYILDAQFTTCDRSSTLAVMGGDLRSGSGMQ